MPTVNPTVFSPATPRSIASAGVYPGPFHVSSAAAAPVVVTVRVIANVRVVSAASRGSVATLTKRAPLPISVTTAATPGSHASLTKGLATIVHISVASAASPKSSAQILKRQPPQLRVSPGVLSKLLRLWSIRGQSLAKQIQALINLVNSSPVNLAAIVGPVMLLSQAFAEAQASALDWVMNDPAFSGFSLELQHEIGKQSSAWRQMFAMLGSLAFENQLPNLQSITQANPGARIFGASGLARSIDIKLESFLSVPILAGITVKSFWTTTTIAVSALSRLLTLDWVISSDPTFYYGPMGNVGSILTDALLVLDGVGPLVPSVSALLTQINQAIADGYNEKTVVSLRSISVPHSLDLRQLAAQMLGDPELWTEIVSFNHLVFPFISDDPIEQLGPPDQIGSLTLDGVNGATSLSVTGFGPFYADQRILLQCGGNFQVATILSGAFTSALNPVDWDALTDFDVRNDTFVVVLDQPLNTNFPAATTSVKLLPAVYDTGVVLGTGGALLIPTALEIKASLITNATDTQRFGTDIFLDNNGNLIISDGDIQLVEGVDNFKQAISHRFEVSRGELVYHPAYGNGRDKFIGHKGSPYYGFLVATDAVQTVLADPRAAKVLNPNVELNGDVLDVEFEVQPTTGQLIFPVKLQVNVPG